MARKNKIHGLRIDFRDEEVLSTVERLARAEYDNKQIGAHFNYCEATFSRKVNSIDELKKALMKGREPLEINVENSLYRRATGLKVTSTVRRFIETDCQCGGKDKQCPHCKGAGKVADKERELVQETVTELPPETNACMNWLKNRRPDRWNSQPDKKDVTTNGRDITGVVLSNLQGLTDEDLKSYNELIDRVYAADRE
jgi:hypothetical protein